MVWPTFTTFYFYIVNKFFSFASITLTPISDGFLFLLFFYSACILYCFPGIDLMHAYVLLRYLYLYFHCSWIKAGIHSALVLILYQNFLKSKHFTADLEFTQNKNHTGFLIVPVRLGKYIEEQLEVVTFILYAFISS